MVVRNSHEPFKIQNIEKDVNVQNVNDCVLVGCGAGVHIPSCRSNRRGTLQQFILPQVRPVGLNFLLQAFKL